MKISRHSCVRRSLSVLIITICFAFVGSFQSASAQKLDSIERQRTQDMLKTIKGSLKENYYDPTFHGMDVETRFKTADEKLKQANSLGQALGIVAQVLLDLNDSHTYFQPPRSTISVDYGWRMQAIGDKCFISAVKPGTDAEAKGLKTGDLILSVDGFKPSRKELWKLEYYYYALSPRPGIHLAVQSPGQPPRELDVAAKVRQLKRVIDLAGRNANIDLNDYIRESEDDDKFYQHRFQKMGSVIIWKMPNFSFLPEQAESLMAEEVNGKSGLILDLRGNPGGYVLTLERLAGRFFDHDVKIADLKGRKAMKPQVAKTSGKDTFAGKLIVLIDSKSGSAAELFARLMQIEKRGVVIGDVSSGSVMQSRSDDHSIGVDTIIQYGASITNADVIMTDGKSLEHVGVIPDELLLPTAEDLAANRDPVLARAAELMGVKLDPGKAGLMFPLKWR
jgi:C-terminal processing protease CtpA/Prc